MGQLILINEHDPVTIRFLHSLLTGEGFEVIGSGGTEKAYRLFMEREPHLVMGNLATDSEDVYMLLRAVRRDPRAGDIPYVVLSERVREEEIVRAFEAGADDYIMKPFKARELVARIRRLLQRATRTGFGNPR